MNVIDAVNGRSSVRSFTSQPVADELLRSLVADASRAPSGGNIQPWRIYVVNGGAMTRLREFLMTQPMLDQPLEYVVFPQELTEPYRSNRNTVGAHKRQLEGNNDFFGAPAALFCYVDRQMGSAQWSDLGMYLQTFMLLAFERGLATCAQQCWSTRHRAVREFLGAPQNEMLFSAVSIGHGDDTAPGNARRTPRMAVDDFASFL
jgi:nitroreductase